MKKTEKPKVQKRGNVTFVIYADRVLVGTANQWISYNPYENWNRAGITTFIEKIKKSKETEYATIADVMTLAYECDIKGMGTRAPQL